MKYRVALLANAILAAIAAIAATSASYAYWHRPEVPAELQRKK